MFRSDVGRCLLLHNNVLHIITAMFSYIITFLLLYCFDIRHSRIVRDSLVTAHWRLLTFYVIRLSFFGFFEDESILNLNLAYLVYLLSCALCLDISGNLTRYFRLLLV
jgi:hypothetical protein